MRRWLKPETIMERPQRSPPKVRRCSPEIARQSFMPFRSTIAKTSLLRSTPRPTTHSVVLTSSNNSNAQHARPSSLRRSAKVPGPSRHPRLVRRSMDITQSCLGSDYAFKAKRETVCRCSLHCPTTATRMFSTIACPTCATPLCSPEVVSGTPTANQNSAVITLKGKETCSPSTARQA